MQHKCNRKLMGKKGKKISCPPDQDKDHDEQQVILPSMPADSQESISTETNDNCISSQTDANLPDAELSVDQIIKLH